ncbi:MAG: hypothetical protein Q9226_000798 [Calogaya cf. arnoldii]
MRISFLALSLLPLLVESTNIVLSNDDGWAELNIRVFYDSLTRARNSVVLSAPADNKSGTDIVSGSLLKSTRPWKKKPPIPNHPTTRPPIDD